MRGGGIILPMLLCKNFLPADLKHGKLCSFYCYYIYFIIYSFIYLNFFGDSNLEEDESDIWTYFIISIDIK